MASINPDAIVVPTEFDISNISYGEPHTLANGGKAIYVSYMNKNGKKNPLILQTPEMSVPFGLGCWKNDGGSNKYTIDLSFKGMENREVLKKLFDGLRAFEKKIVNDAFTNSQAWLKKTFKSAEFVETLSTPVVRFAKDKNGEVTDKYPPTFKVTVPFKDGRFTCDVYDKDRNIINLSDIEEGAMKGARVSALIQCLGLWVAGGKFGTSFKVLQMRVTPNQTVKGYAFKEIEDKIPEDIDDDEDDDDVPTAAGAKEVIDNAIVSDQEKDDDDNDSDVVESSDDELDAKPTKVVKKKAVSKK